jgi:predicted Zn-dependent peptidase
MSARRGTARGRFVLAAGVAALVLGACGGSPAVVATAPASEPNPVAVPPEPAQPTQTPGGNPFTEPPVLGPVDPLVVPAVVERRLSNGLRVLVVEHHELPLADILLIVRSGSEAESPARAGLATLAANMLDESAGGRSALEIAEQISFLGISLGTGAGWDQSRVSLHTPIAQLDSALALMADVTLRPTFPANEFDRLKKERLTALLQQRDRGPAIADVAFSYVLFGDEHPYGHPQLGTEATVGALALGDVQAFYQTHFRPNNATVVVVGDVQPDDVTRRLERWLGGWRPGAIPETRFPSPPPAGSRTVHLIDKPGAAQSSVRIGVVGAPRSTADYFPLVVMNTVLGGAFTSRLNQNLREDKGYTYGAFSAFDMRRVAGPFLASAEIVTEKSDSALIEALSEIRGMHEPVPTAELEKAKSYIQLGLPSEFETTGGIASRLVPVALYDLPLDYFGNFSRNVGAVTQAEVQRVARQYLTPERLQIVVVGDTKVIEGGIRAANVGDVVRRDLSGKPVTP